MTRDDIEAAVSLNSDADTTHESAEDWYDSYGAHISTEDAADVTVQAIPYDWLDDQDDDSIVSRLMQDDERLSRDEAEALVALAQRVREAADTVCGSLDEAVEAYQRGDLGGVKAALLAAYSHESDHGDTPATSVLAGQLLVTPSDD